MVAGVTPRAAAASLLGEILRRKRPIDDALSEALNTGDLAKMDARDRGFVRALLMASLRYHVPLRVIMKRFINRPLPAKTLPAEDFILTAAAELLILKNPAHAVINDAVQLTKTHKSSRPVSGLVNAVLRRIHDKADKLRAELDQITPPVPEWLWQRWLMSYGMDQAWSMAKAARQEPALDVTVTSGIDHWAEQLGGIRLPTGSIRITHPSGRIEDLPGYGAGAWWVQDAAAALPVQLAGEVHGKSALDVCAAPGGKTAQLCARGARVTALDVSKGRLKRLEANLDRLGLKADIAAVDIFDFSPGTGFDIVLLDAPCSATGTLRRHPDIPHLKSNAQIRELAAVQAGMLDHCARLVSPGGMLIYCTCSLEPDEGETQIEAFLQRNTAFVRQPIDPILIGGQSQLINAHGDLRTRPSQSIGSSPGLDGFFASCLVRL